MVEVYVSRSWVDTDNGMDGQVDVRSSLVPQDFKSKGIGKDKKDSLYASMPPLKGLRTLCSKAAAPEQKGKRRKVLLMGARKAHKGFEVSLNF